MFAAFSPSCRTISYIRCYDNLRKSIYISSAQLGTIGAADVAFEQVDDGDVAAPTVSSLVVMPAEVNTSVFQQQVTFYLGVADDSLGVSYCNVYFRQPTTNRATSVRVGTLVNGTNTNGTMSGVYTLAANSPAGKYTVYQVYCRDQRGRSVTLTSAALGAIGASNAGFSQVAQPDNAGPIIKAVSVSPVYVNTAAAPALINVMVNFTDASGFSRCTVYFYEPGTTINRLGVNVYGNSGLAAGTLMSGSAVGSASLPQHSLGGLWRFSSMTCYDIYSKTTRLSLAQIQPISNVGFNQTSPGDAKGPEVSGVTVSPVVLNTSASSQIVTVTVNASDDASGVQYCQVYWRGPSGASSYSMTARQLVSGVSTDGVFSGTFTLAKGTVKGKW